MNGTGEIACIILAGGKGKRMASAKRHKVCFPILGRPAIVRAIETYKAAGLRRFVVVVGQMAEQVISTVSESHPEVTFVHQAEPKGTGHAASIAARALAAQGYEGPAMVVMGDKVTRPEVVRRLLALAADARADVVMATLPKGPLTTAGRVVTGAGGRVLGIIEAKSIEHARRTRAKLRLAGRFFSAAQVERQSPTVNASMYLFRFGALREALKHMRTDHAQGELLLTDTVEYIVGVGRKVESFAVPDPTDLMAFNTPAELLAIEEVVGERERPGRVSVARRKRLSGRMLKSAGEWEKILRSDSPELLAKLRRIYGTDEAFLVSRRRAMMRVVGAFIRRHGKDRPMILCRAPGRVNLMGRHVDHRGGYVNVMAISREVLLAAGPR
ncbi:MAG: NTP transferase domain-containing protein, partial [Phycisphaerae bacterium]|nr:NTP transferase domain-containing protein [Phycisphaerae bacterium]